jgi:MFS superfamily sulfate permease-like transporter
MAAISHGFFLAAFVLLLPWLLNMIPLSCLAAVLLLVGYKLANIGLFRKMFKNGLSQFIPFIVTILVIVFINLLWGIIAGLAVAIFYILKRSYENALYSKFVEKAEGESNKTIIELGDVVSFFNKGHLHKKLSELKENSYVVIDGTNNKHMDYDIFDLLDDFMINAQSKNIRVAFKGFDTQRSEKLSDFINEMTEKYENTHEKDTK